MDSDKTVGDLISRDLPQDWDTMPVEKVEDHSRTGGGSPTNFKTNTPISISNTLPFGMHLQTNPTGIKNPKA